MKKRILDLGISQKDAAQNLGVKAATVVRWLNGSRTPDLRHFPAVIRFLKYDPRPVAESLGQALVRWRKGRGRSQEELAATLSVDPATLALWERGRRVPTAGPLERINALFRKDDS